MPDKWALLKMSHSDPLELSLKGISSFDRLSPRECLDHILDGKVDFSVVSLLSYFEHRNDLIALPEPVIAFSGQTFSTLLVSNGAPLARNMKIAISGYTKTTRWYLDAVLNALRIEHSFVESDLVEAEGLLSEADYALVIGDEALKIYSGTRSILLDVGFEFQRTFGMDPLYAISVARVERKPSNAEWFRDSGLHFQACAADLSRKTGISKELANRYYGNLRYTFDSRSKMVLEFVSGALEKT